MSKSEWINAVYELLCRSQGAPVNKSEENHLMEWAKYMAGEERNYYQDGLTPEEAHKEEMRIY